MSNLLHEVEALLFASGKALSVDYLSELTGASKKDVIKALNDLRDYYDERKGALFIWNDGSLWKMNVREKYSSLVSKIVADTELPRPVLETLALIAYKAPVLQSEIIDSRGTSAYEHISDLLKRGFIVRERFGRSFKLRLTDKFFRYFELADPELRELFKGVKRPDPSDAPKKLGQLEVVDVSDDFDDFAEKRKQLKLEIYSVKEDLEKDKSFLDEFDSRLDDLSKRVSEDEQEILEHKKSLSLSDSSDSPVSSVSSSDASGPSDASASDVSDSSADSVPELVKKVDSEIEEILRESGHAVSDSSDDSSDSSDSSQDKPDDNV